MKKIPVSLGMFVALLALGRVHATAYPPTPYFHLPVSVAGTPQFYGGDGTACNASNNNCTKTDTSTPSRCGHSQWTPCRSYLYGVAANVLPNHKKSNAIGYYSVAIYASIDTARQENELIRDARIPNLVQPAPLRPIAQPLNTSEWLRGERIPGTAGNCIVKAGVRYRNVTMLSYSLGYRSVTLPASSPCAAEYRWATRVLTALYVRVVRYADGH